MKNKILPIIFSFFLLCSCTTYKFGTQSNNFLMDETAETNKDIHEFDLSYTYKVMGIPVKGEKAIVEDAFVHPDNKTMFLIISFPKIGILKTEDNGRTFTSNFFKSSYLNDVFGYNNDSSDNENTKRNNRSGIHNRLFCHIAYSPVDQNKVVISFGPYIFISIDKGEKWSIKNIFLNLEKTNIKDIFVTDKEQIIIFSENIMAISNDWGKRWQKYPLNLGGIPSYKVNYITGFYDNQKNIIYASIKYIDEKDDMLSLKSYEYFYKNQDCSLKSGLYYSRDMGKTWIKSKIPVPVLIWKNQDKLYAAPLYPLFFYKYPFDEEFKNSYLYKSAKLDNTTKNALQFAKILLNLKPEEYDVVSSYNNKLVYFKDIEKDVTHFEELNFDNLYNAMVKLQSLPDIQWESYWYENKKSTNFDYQYNLYNIFKLWTGYRTNSPVIYARSNNKKIYYRIIPDPVFFKVFIYYCLQNQIRLNSINPFLKKTTDIEFFDPASDPTNGFPVILEYSANKGKTWKQLEDSKHIRAIIDPLNSKRSGFYWYKNIDQKKIAKLQFSFGWTEGVSFMVYPQDLFFFNNQLFLAIDYFSVSKSYEDLYVIPVNK